MIWSTSEARRIRDMSNDISDRFIKNYERVLDLDDDLPQEGASFRLEIYGAKVEDTCMGATPGTKGVITITPNDPANPPTLPKIDRYWVADDSKWVIPDKCTNYDPGYVREFTLEGSGCTLAAEDLSCGAGDTCTLSKGECLKNHAPLCISMIESC
jgi:hypothetical protein